VLQDRRSEKAKSPAEIYDSLFVPALFRQWGPIIAQAARIEPGQRVIDVACGTGVLALAALECVGADGAVTGLDPNADMLGVASRKSARIQWRDGRAEELPFPDETFDAAVSQFGLMFFAEPAKGLREMMRVLRPGGRLAVAVCDALAHSPGYDAFAALLERLFGDQVANAFRAPFVLGDVERLRSLCAQAGIKGAEVKQLQGKVRFASIASLVSTERACVWTLGGLLDDAQFNRLMAEAENALQPYRETDGSVAFDMPALIITAVKQC
jgi:ubiquinone/menaquinone biosynthesis C-methylase UbiE